MIFQSTGAHYNLRSALKNLFVDGSERDSERLRGELIRRYGGRSAVLFHKGRAALSEAVARATDGSGKVAVTGFTCYSVPQAVWTAGCEVVYVDIDKNTLQFGIDEIMNAYAKHPDISVIVIQNTLGIPVNIEPIEKFALEKGIVIIEDLAHSAGAHYSDGREVGTVGALTMLSFGKDKALDTVNGGALVVRDERFARQAQQLQMPRPIDQLRDRIYPMIGLTSRKLYRIGIGKLLLALAYKLKLAVRSADGDVNTAVSMPHWQAKLAFERLGGLEERIKHRRSVAVRVVQKLAPHIPSGALNENAVLVRIPIYADDRANIITKLRKDGIYVQDIWYDTPVSPERYFDRAKYVEEDCPVAVEVAKKIINLPTHENVSSEEIDKAVAVIASEVSNG